MLAGAEHVQPQGLGVFIGIILISCFLITTPGNLKYLLIFHCGSRAL